jgi:hypothetical protein
VNGSDNRLRHCELRMGPMTFIVRKGIERVVGFEGLRGHGNG